MGLIAFDTNLAVYALNERAVEHGKARALLESFHDRDDVAICELMLVELYLKVCNQTIFPHPWTPREATKICQRFRSNPRWALIESAPVMSQVWTQSAKSNFSPRRLIDLRLAFTLRHHGVTVFYTRNTKDFQGLGFESVVNPIDG